MLLLHALVRTVVIASCLLVAGPAAAVQLVSDDREVSFFAFICDLTCETVGGSQTPSAPFAPFDASLDGDGSGYTAAQVSTVGPDLITGQGSASGSVDGDAHSALRIEFQVLDPTTITFDASFTVVYPGPPSAGYWGDAIASATLDVVDGANVFSAGACGFCIPDGESQDLEDVFIETVLQPGSYQLSVLASVEEFGESGSWDVSLAFASVPEPTSLALLALGLGTAARAGSRRRAA